LTASLYPDKIRFDTPTSKTRSNILTELVVANFGSQTDSVTELGSGNSNVCGASAH
jgi:hypothetical protein